MVLGAPLLAGLISEFFMYLSDSAMVGRLGTEYLAAMAIAVMVAEILWIIIWPLAPATQSIASQKYGRATAIHKKDDPEYKKQIISTGDVFNNSLLLAVGAGALAVLLAGLCKPFLSLVLDDPSLIPLIDSYVHIVKWAMPVAGVFYGLYGFLAAINLTIPIMIATIGLNVLNIGFNYILIFGKFGCPALGIEGAALGTVLASVAGTIYLVAYVLVSKDLRQYKCFSINGFNPKVLKTLIKAGTPITGQLVVVFGIYLYYETLIANLGTVYLAATHIFLNVLGMGVYAAWSAFAIQIVVYMAILTVGFFSKKWLYVEVLA
jgi:MATE family multidrug resistance protein